MSTLNITDITVENPLTISAAMALSETDRLALLEAFLNGTLVARGDNVIPKPIREGGTRGMLPRVQAAHDRLEAAFLKLAARPEGVNTKDLQIAAHQQLFEGAPGWEYHYIRTVADNLLSHGLITETKKGRAATWNLVA